MAPSRALGVITLVACLVPHGRAAPNTETYGLVFIVDGARGDLFKRYALEGLMPNVRKYFIDEGVWVEHATSPFPTITGAGMPALLTGCHPGRHSIPSLYFFSRSEMKYPVLYAAGEALGWDRWLSPDVKTLWERFPGKDDAISFGPALHRGSDQHVSIFWNFHYEPMEIRTRVRFALRDLKQAILGRPPARLTVVYNGWFDHMEHVLGSTTPEILDHYRAIDEQIGSILAVFTRSIQRRARPGRPVKIAMALASDHGHQEIREVRGLERFVRDKLGARVLDKVWRRLFGLKIFGKLPRRFDDREVVVASGEGHALLYFPTPVVDEKSRTVRALDWKRSPPLSLLRDYPLRDRRIDVIAEVLATGAVAFAVGRDRQTGLVHVWSANGEATIERRGAGRESSYAYRVVTGRDPLGFAKTPATKALVGGEFRDGKAWQEATLETEYPDAIVQLAQAFDVEDRSPDLYLSASPYVSFGDLVDDDKSKSKHGGLTREESWTMLAFHATDLLPGTVRTARAIDMAPTLLDLMDVPYDPASMDGEVLPGLRHRAGTRPVLP